MGLLDLELIELLVIFLTFEAYEFWVDLTDIYFSHVILTIELVCALITWEFCHFLKITHIHTAFITIFLYGYLL